jgi:monoamine oxidase
MVNIVVIGAGLSGLICAKELLRLSSSTSTSTSTSTSNSNINDDIHIHILEARGRFGGRMYQQGGVDLGATWSWPRHDTALVKVAQELGIQFEKQYTNGMAISHIVPLEGNGKGTTQSAGRDVSPAGDGSIRFENGAASIIEKLVEELRASDRITFELNQEVTAITMTAEDPIAYEINSSSTLTPPASSDNNTCSDPGNLSSMISASVVVLALPPQLAATISFSPPLSHQKLTAMEQTPTWMANTGKVLIISSPTALRFLIINHFKCCLRWLLFTINPSGKKRV